MKKKPYIPSLVALVKTYFANQFTHHPVRCAEMLRVMSKYQLYHVIAQLGTLSRQKKQDWSEDLLQEHGFYADNLARAFEELGTCFIKLGQMLSTRPDLLPPPYITALARLQYTVTPVASNQIIAVIETDLGASLADLFRSFDIEPLATASIAQVHKALLHDGTPVVIKVQRPGVQQQVEGDLEVLLEITRFLSRHTPLGTSYELTALVQEMKHSLLQELDFFQEANHTQSISQDLRTFQHLTAPTIYPAYSSRQVLTLSFIPGRHLAHITNDELSHFAATTIAHELLFAYLKQVIIHGVFHCDPHPGNLLLTDDGRLALLDFGMIGRLDTRQIEHVILLLLAFSECQGERVAALYLEMVETPKNFERRAFIQHICELVWRYYERSQQGIAFGRALLDLVALASTYHLSIPPNFALLGKAMLNLDGTLHRLSPNLNLTQVLHRYLPQLIQQRAFAQISPGRSLTWLLDTKHLVENMLRRSDVLLEKMASEQGATGAHIEQLSENIHRASLRLSLSVIASSLVLTLVLLVKEKRRHPR